MNFFVRTYLNRLLFLLGLVFFSAILPIKALALNPANAAQQHFSAAISASNWNVTTSAGTYILGWENSEVAPYQDPEDSSPSENAALYSAIPVPGASVTVTYTEVASMPQSFLKLDIYTKNENYSPEIIATDGTNSVTALSGSDDILENPPTCWSSAPVSESTTDASLWETILIDVHTLGAITQVQFIFADNNGDMNSPGNPGTVYLDNLRGDVIVSCFTVTPTPTFTATETPGGPTDTPTNTPTNSPTNSPTDSPTNTPTNSSPTATFTNTPTNTASPTITNTPTITYTPTITLTPTPAPCQPEVYPNPMDFTASHNIAVCPTGKCIVFSCLPTNATVKIYTVSLSLVRVFNEGSVLTAGANLPPGSGYIAWDGTNGSGTPVASGLYFYVVNAPSGNTFGKFAISKSLYGP